jgi:hypothetical protein
VHADSWICSNKGFFLRNCGLTVLSPLQPPCDVWHKIGGSPASEENAGDIRTFPGSGQTQAFCFQHLEQALELGRSLQKPGTDVDQVFDLLGGKFE